MPSSDARSTSLYRFFDSADALLYVGVTSRGPERWKDHEVSREWWAQVDHTTVAHFPTREEAEAAEREAIRGELPRYNIVHAKARAKRRPSMNRPWGAGSIVLRGDGYWQFSVGEKGKRHFFRLRTQAEAEFIAAVWMARSMSRLTKDKAIRILEEPQ